MGRLIWPALVVVLAALRTARAASSVEVPIEVHEAHVYVRVTVNGTENLWFLIDSGAATPVNLIDAQVAAKIGLKGEAQETAGAIGGQIKVTLTAPAAMQIGELRIPPAPLAMISLGDHENAEGHKVDGILGYAFFSAFNPEIDYKNGRMRLSDAPTQGDDGSAVVIQIVEKSCRVNAEIVVAKGQAPLPVSLVVDTGFDGNLVLTRPFVEKHNLRSIGGQERSGGSLGGGTTGLDARIAWLRLGNESASDLQVRLSNDKEGAFASAAVDGYLGGEFLQHYRVLFDYKHGRLLLKKQ
jgi:predicted aspartyl protease